MSDTPRTDALMSDMSEGWPDRWAESHAQLERELDEAQAEIVRECIAQVRKDENGPAYEAAGRIAQHFGIE